MLEGFDATKTNMMGAAVRAVDHGIGFAGQLIMEALVDQPAVDWRSGSAVDDIVGNAAILAALGRGPVHGLDGVAAHAEVAKIALGFQPHHPLPGTGRAGEAHLLQMLEAANHQAAGLGIGGTAYLRTQVDGTDVVGIGADLYVEAGPPLRRDFLLQGVADLVLGPRAKLDRRQILGP